MASYKKYNRALHQKFGYRATWSPGTPLKIGDVGEIDNDGVFRPVGTLDGMGITGADVRAGSQLENMEFTSNKGVSIATKAKGQAPAVGTHLTEAEAGFSINFSSDSAIVFRASQPSEDIIVNTGNIGQQILEKFNAGSWDKNYMVITSLVHAEAATIIISGDKGGQIDISASGKAQVADSDLANADVSLDVKFSNKVSEKIVGAKGLTPLYRVHGIKKRFLLNGKFVARSVNHLSDADKANLQEKHVFEHYEFVAED